MSRLRRTGVRKRWAPERPTKRKNRRARAESRWIRAAISNNAGRVSGLRRPPHFAEAVLAWAALPCTGCIAAYVGLHSGSASVLKSEGRRRLLCLPFGSRDHVAAFRVPMSYFRRSLRENDQGASLFLHGTRACSMATVQTTTLRLA